MSFLKKTTFAKPETTTVEKPKLGTPTGPKLGGLNKSPLKTGGLNKAPAKSLLKKKTEPQELDLEKENTTTEEKIVQPIKPETKPKIGAGLTKKTKLAKEEEPVQEDMAIDSILEDSEAEEDVIKFEESPKEIELEKTEENKGEADNKETKSKKSADEKPKKKTTRKSSKTKKEDNKTEQQVLKAIEVDETKRVPLEEIDAIMRPIVAPTTERWEQEKKDVLEALNAIKVEQDMNMSQVKSCLSELDELKFEILPKQHDAETMYDGTKQNYDTVKAVAIANGSGSNAEARKAEGILACQNFVTPTGAVVDLHQYMLLIEERYKFYEKISDGVNFKKYSLVNYNNAIKAEKEGK